ncbi:hypothetical protein DFJ64_2606 [Thermasporomyces composti]|jgi:hypothetical protein|uniref:Uncharacterized protein n=1 Tax=Thermasporomyces composti TaxID=696763 RepID=A0A3D9V775_THECX|nr:hypothetical protein DFJ64_2606 [Thermasporomyces composti]
MPLSVNRTRLVVEGTHLSSSIPGASEIVTGGLCNERLRATMTRTNNAPPGTDVEAFRDKSRSGSKSTVGSSPTLTCGAEGRRAAEEMLARKPA